jgi:hypothetical protein
MVQKSRFVCKVCGVSAITWFDGWKHAAGGGERGCGRRPRPIERSRYQARLEGEIRAARGMDYGAVPAIHRAAPSHALVAPAQKVSPGKDPATDA